MPHIVKTIHCLKCAADTSQSLVPSASGCSWQCEACSNQIHAYSHAEMANVVTTKVFGIPTSPKPCGIPESLKVYMEHHGPDAEEKEVDTNVVKEHVSITGSLPKVGKPLFVKPRGLDHPVLAVPFGKVTRIEQ